jgi:hypothetical protein
MAKDDLKNIGYFDEEVEEKLKSVDVKQEKRDRESKGFVPGGTASQFKREKKEHDGK